MATRSDHLDAPDFIVRDEVDDLFGHANPNPSRLHCPNRDVLAALARHQLPIDDPGYEHLGFCSPCYQEFCVLQQAPSQAAPIAASHRGRWIAAIAAAIILLVGGAWLLVATRNRTSQPGPPPQAPVLAAVSLELDLRPYAVSRSPQEQGSRPRLALPRSLIAAVLLLPAGSEPGAYEIQLRDATSRPLASSSGEADIRNFVTTLRATVDLRNVQPGGYELALRRPGEGWRLYLVNVR